MTLESDHPMEEKLVRIRESLGCPKGKSDCSGCESLTGDCRSMVNFEYNVIELFDLMLRRFSKEEELMHLIDARRGRDSQFESHKESHADMMRQVSELFAVDHPSHLKIKTICNLIDYWLYEHVPTHDVLLQGVGTRI